MPISTFAVCIHRKIKWWEGIIIGGMLRIESGFPYLERGRAGAAGWPYNSMGWPLE